MPEQRIFEYENHWLVKRTDTPNYHVYWCRPGTRRVRRKSTGTSNFEEAKRRLIEIARQRNGPVRRTPDAVPVLAVLADYVEITMRDKPSRFRAKQSLELWADFLEREDLSFVSELSLDVQQRYVDWRRGLLRDAGHAASNATIQRDLTDLKAAVRAYWKRGLIDTTPHVMALPQPEPRQRYLSRAEFDRLLSECREPHLRLFVLLAIHTLQRPGAILELTTPQVDLDRGVIDFLPPWQRTQTSKRKAVVPISEGIRGPLTEAVRSSLQGFVVEYDGAPMRSIRTSFNKARDRAGLGKEVCPYVLRHTGSTWLAAAGVPLRQIAGMLGHADTRTTERHYAKHAPEYLKQATGAMDRLLGSRNSS